MFQALVVGVWIGNGSGSRDILHCNYNILDPCFVFKTLAKPWETVLFMLCPMHTSLKAPPITMLPDGEYHLEMKKIYSRLL